MVKAEVMDQCAFESVMDNYQANLELRGKQYIETKQSKYTDEEDEEEEGGQDDPYAVPSDIA